MSKSERELDTPPYFSSWKTIYWLVTAFLVLVVVVLSIFSAVYQ